MHRPRRSSPSETQRVALLRFEALYEEWRVACLNLMEAEEKLMAESLRDRGNVPDSQAARVAMLRDRELEARMRAYAARDDADE